VTLSVSTAAHAQQFGPPPSGFIIENPVLRRLWAMGMDSSMLERYAQVMFDSIGPRLVGTPQMESSQDWIIRNLPGPGHHGTQGALRHLARLAPRPVAH